MLEARILLILEYQNYKIIKKIYRNQSPPLNSIYKELNRKLAFLSKFFRSLSPIIILDLTSSDRIQFLLLLQAKT